jgi:CheY-like chemotaxis protein/HPt (histidine-containing phosphotransfer) domain-containing protein
MSATLDNEELFELMQNFISTAKESLDNIESLILKAETQKNQNSTKLFMKEILGITHSLKGTSASFKLKSFSLICHKLEDYIAGLVNQNKIISSEELTNLLKHTDLLSSYCVEFAAHNEVDDLRFQENYNKIFLTTNIANVPPGQPPRVLVSSTKLYILIVGINKTIMKQIYMSLIDINYSISFATDTLEALHRLTLEKFDLIISSSIMDPINGISFTMAVKNQWKEKAPKIILLSSEPIQIKSVPYLAPDKIILKSPSLPEELNQYFKKDFSHFVKTQKDKKLNTVYNIKSIYFVEDDPNILELFLFVLSEKKDVVLFNEVTTSDPLEKIIQLMPDLIICDIHVPNVDTVGLLHKIKTSEKLNKVPVVFFTGDPDQPIASELIRMGALAVLDKTIILSSMFDEFEKLGIQLKASV